MLRVLIEKPGKKGFTFENLQAQTGWHSHILEKGIGNNIESGDLVKADSYYLSAPYFDSIMSRILEAVESHHKEQPLSPGIMRETLREKSVGRIPVEIFKAAVSALEGSGNILGEKDIVRLVTHTQNLSVDEETVREKILQIYGSSGLKVPTLEKALEDSISGTKISAADARKVFQLLIDSGEVVKITGDMYFDSRAIEELIKNVRNYAENETDDRLITVPIFKDIAGISRKYAIPLLEYLDGTAVTRRAGDKRLVV